MAIGPAADQGVDLRRDRPGDGRAGRKTGILATRDDLSTVCGERRSRARASGARSRRAERTLDGVAPDVRRLRHVSPRDQSAVERLVPVRAPCLRVPLCLRLAAPKENGPARHSRCARGGLPSWWTVDGLLLTAILGVAATVRLWAISFGLPHPNARPDEDAVALNCQCLLPRRLRSHGLRLSAALHAGSAGTWRLVFSLTPPTLAWMHIRPTMLARTLPVERIAARLLSAAAGIASVWLIFRIGLRLFAAFRRVHWRRLPRARLPARARFAFRRDRHPDDLHVVLVAFLAIVKLSESGSDPDLAAASLLTGLAVATKYNAALLVLPASFAILDDPRRRPLVARFGRIAVYGLLMVGAFLVVCPYAVVRYDQFIADMMFNARHLAEGHGADLGRGWAYHVTTTLRYGLGLPLFAAGLVGVPLVMWREPRRGVLVALFPIAYYLLIGSGRTVFARYILPVVPFLCLTAGYAVSCAAAWLTRSLGRPRVASRHDVGDGPRDRLALSAVGCRVRSAAGAGGCPPGCPSLDRSALRTWRRNRTDWRADRLCLCGRRTGVRPVRPAFGDTTGCCRRRIVADHWIARSDWCGAVARPRVPTCSSPGWW